MTPLGAGPGRAAVGTRTGRVRPGAVDVRAVRPGAAADPPAGAVLDDPTGLVGGTPLVRLRSLLGPAGHFWAKLEGRNPGGMKARAALSMVESALRRGALRPGGRIVESTSGTLGLALAFVAVTRGFAVSLVADPGLEPMVRNLLRAHGVELHVVERPDPVGGWQEARRRRVAELLERHPDAFWPDQYDNPDNPAGYASLAAELLRQLPRVDVLVCSVGTGGHSAGLVRVLRRRWPALRLVGVDSVRSTIFGQPAGPRLMRGLGSSIHPRNIAYPTFDDVHWVSPAESVTAARALARRTWVTGGWSTGAVALVASWYADISDGVVCAVFPDGPERYWATVFSDEYCAEHGLLADALPRCPCYVDDPAGADPVDAWSFTRAVRDPLGRRPADAPGAVAR